jgi:predicted ATPase/DNA-binding SARP family transcriptional activator
LAGDSSVTVKREAGCERDAQRDLCEKAHFNILDDMQAYTRVTMTHGGAAVYVELLGRARAHVGPAWVDFLADKRYWLLAYLAYSDSWVSRDQLAYLFWPDKRTDEAKQDLRGLIKRVRTLGWVTGLETKRHGLRWEVKTDVAAFFKALEDDQPSVALSLYRGPLLKGLDSYDAEEFSTWLTLEREHLHASWRQALLQRADELQRQGQERRAASLLGSLLEQDELDEEALRAYLGAAARARQPQEALRAYRNFARKLREELDLEPTAATLDLIEAIKVQKPTPTTTSHPVTSFVGRDVELRELTALLARPQCRLLTLTGPGGVGKTCLALQAVGELKRRYPEGAYFISLEALSAPESIAPTLAETLGVAFVDDPLGQLIRHVGERRLLLALDNFEHLLKGATLASRLVQSCPNLKLLITSRERLDLHEEWILPVEGLPFPARGDLTPEEALSFDAVRLLVERARRVRPEFRLTENELPHIVRICQLVDGFPLGLELAAVWVRLMTCAAIVREIEASLDFLASATRDLPERQRSMWATFEHSWKLLTSKEQEIFRKLSVFEGGLTQEAASVVAGAPLTILASLLDKSLLRVSPEGRYDRHPLLYRYSREKLAEMPEERAEMQEKHGTYYLCFLQVDSRQEFAEELENLRAAWRWALTAGKVAELQLAVRPLTSFFEREARYQEGVDLLAEAAGRLEAGQALWGRCSWPKPVSTAG